MYWISRRLRRTPSLGLFRHDVRDRHTSNGDPVCRRLPRTETRSETFRGHRLDVVPGDPRPVPTEKTPSLMSINFSLRSVLRPEVSSRIRPDVRQPTGDTVFEPTRAVVRKRVSLTLRVLGRARLGPLLFYYTCLPGPRARGRTT